MKRRPKPDRELASRKADGELASALHALGLEWDVVGGKQVARASIAVRITRDVSRRAFLCLRWFCWKPAWRRVLACFRRGLDRLDV